MNVKETYWRIRSKADTVKCSPRIDTETAPERIQIYSGVPRDVPIWRFTSQNPAIRNNNYSYLSPVTHSSSLLSREINGHHLRFKGMLET